MSVGVDPGGDQGVHVDHAAVFADFDGQRIGPYKAVRACIQRALAKHRHLGTQVGRHLTDCDRDNDLAASCSANRSTRRVDTPSK